MKKMKTNAVLLVLMVLTSIGTSAISRRDSYRALDKAEDIANHTEMLQAELVGMLGARAITDLNGVVLEDPNQFTWTPEMERLTGWKYEEIVGKNVSLIIPPNMGHPANFDKAHNSWPEGKVQSISCDIVQKNGTIVPVSGNVRFKLWKGKPVAQGDFQDVREIIRHVSGSVYQGDKR